MYIFKIRENVFIPCEKKGTLHFTFISINKTGKYQK